ncbi:MAG: class I SAM-dependent methyltransferase [Candidatus Micrarchaeia archaeon]
MGLQMNLNSFFSKIASHYDKFIGLVSIGIDKKLLSEAINESKLAGRGKKKVLDVATGTGRIAFAIARKYKNYDVMGIDINSEMLGEALKKGRGLKNLSYSLGNVESLEFEDNKFDIVVSAFSLSLFDDLPKAVAEMHRVLKPSGKLILMDMLKPKDSVLRKLLDLYYSANVLPSLDARFRHEMELYIRKTFNVDKNHVIELLKEAGYKNINQKEFSGIAFVITASK